MDAARTWGLTPSEWWGASDEDRAMMLAHHFTRQRMQAVEAMEQGREMQRASRKAKRRS